MDISKPTTTRTKQDIENFNKGWDRIFGKRIAVTFEHDFSDYAKLWRDYYSQFMDIKIIKIGDMLRNDWGATTKLLNSTQEELFKKYDLILYADVDEILIPDPEHYRDLGEYLTTVKGVARCTGYNVVELEGDKPLELDKPILTQRGNWIRDKLYDKFVILTEPQHFLNNHHISNEVPCDPNLVMFHLRDSDIARAKERNKKLGVTFNQQDLDSRRQNTTKIPDKWLNLV